MKRIIAIALAIIMCIIPCNNVFADELDTPVEPEIIDEMYASGTYTVPANSSIDTSTFYLSDPYFAFEMRATYASGGPASGKYKVALKRGSSTKASGTNYVNGSTIKIDWISIISGTHKFTITNNTAFPIIVTLTYYSWT